MTLDSSPGTPITIFLKLGGSVITDKTGVETVREDVLARLASEIQQALEDRLGVGLLMGHGSGSFGHVAAARHDTRAGVATAAQWQGFAAVSATALRLNRLVVEALLAAGVPAISMQPSASARCQDGRLAEMATGPIEAALDAGLVPVVHGDVAFDAGRGGTIISTEEILAYLAAHIRPALRPDWLLLAGDTPGVLDKGGRLVASISPATYGVVVGALGGSHGTDVTGGMASKVAGMLSLTQAMPGLKVLLFSGLDEGNLYSALVRPQRQAGTLLSQAGAPDQP